jgi:hypothetical protein
MSRFIIAFVLAVILPISRAAAGSPLEFTPPGPYASSTADAHQDAPGFEQGQPIIATTFFYWYDIYTMKHFRDPDGIDGLAYAPVGRHDSGGD